MRRRARRDGRTEKVREEEVVVAVPRFPLLPVLTPLFLYLTLLTLLVFLYLVLSRVVTLWITHAVDSTAHVTRHYITYLLVQQLVAGVLGGTAPAPRAWHLYFSHAAIAMYRFLF